MTEVGYHISKNVGAKYGYSTRALNLIPTSYDQSLIMDSTHVILVLFLGKYTIEYVIYQYSNLYDSVIITIFYLRLYKANQDLKVLLIATNNRMNEMMEKVDARLAKVDKISAKQNVLMGKIEDMTSTI